MFIISSFFILFGMILVGINDPVTGDLGDNALMLRFYIAYAMMMLGVMIAIGTAYVNRNKIEY